MPKGQDRYANRSRKRSPRRGQTTEVSIGKTVGVAPLVGEYDDVCRWLKCLVELGLSADSLKRLRKWRVALAEAEGFTPATDVLPEHQRVLDLQLHKQGILPAAGESDFKPADCIRLKPESPQQRWQREADEIDGRCLHVEELEAAIALARKYGQQDLLAVLEQQYDPEEAKRIKRERHDFTVRYLDFLGANSNQRFLRKTEKDRRIEVKTYGPQTAEWWALYRDEGFDQPGRTKKQDREEGRLVGTAIESHGWHQHGIYAAIREAIQSKGHQLAEDE